VSQPFCPRENATQPGFPIFLRPEFAGSLNGALMNQ
jgi:hypothetical protein